MDGTSFVFYSDVKDQERGSKEFTHIHSYTQIVKTYINFLSSNFRKINGLILVNMLKYKVYISKMCIAIYE